MGYEIKEKPNSVKRAEAMTVKLIGCLSMTYSICEPNNVDTVLIPVKLVVWEETGHQATFNTMFTALLVVLRTMHWQGPSLHTHKSHHPFHSLMLTHRASPMRSLDFFPYSFFFLDRQMSLSNCTTKSFNEKSFREVEENKEKKLSKRR